MRRVISVFGIMALVLTGGSAGAWEQEQCPTDFVTGGGFIITNGFNPTHPPANGNFGVGGSCKKGGDGHGLWGHLEYIDHGSGLNAHWMTITSYRFIYQGPNDPQTGQPTGGRYICGTARTNLYGDVNFVVRAEDKGEPGVDDVFIIRLTQPVGVVFPQHIVYTTEGDPDHTLGGTGPGGGNIQLHKPNPAITPTTVGPCPALSA